MKLYKKSRCVFILGSARLVYLIFVTSMQVSVGSVSIISPQSVIRHDEYDKTMNGQTKQIT